MEFWRYLRDIFIVLAVLLVFSGLVAGWWLFCIVAWLIVTFASWVVDFKPWWRRRGRK